MLKLINLLEINKQIISIKKTLEIKKILSENSSSFIKPFEITNDKKIKKNEKTKNKLICFSSITLSNLNFIKLRCFFSQLFYFNFFL